MSIDADLTGRTLGARYQITTVLGRGGMATVYEATDLETASAVAVKVLRSELSHLVGEYRFTREIRIAQQLVHPNIVPLLDSGTDGEYWYFVMPLLRGGTLRTRIDKQAQLTVDETLRVSAAIASALAHAHQAGVVHRDVKPENILLDGDRVYVADFGIARLFGDPDVEQKLTTTGLVIGTPAYMSPEQSVADPRLDSRSDIYSFGCVMYEMLAGSPPFTGVSPQAVAARHLVEPPPPLRVVRPNVRPHVTSAIERCLAKSPAERFQTVEELVSALFDETASAVAASTSGATPRSGHDARTRRKNTMMRWGTAGMLLVTAIVGTYWRQASAGASGAELRYASFPLVVRGAAAPGLLAHANADGLLYDALRSVLDTLLVDRLRLASQMRVNGVPSRLDSVLALAREVGAKKAIWGEVVVRSDSVFIMAQMYDARREMPDPDITAKAAFSLSDLSATGEGARQFNREFQLLARKLAVNKPDGDAGELMGTDSRPALLAKLSADSARYRWNLPLALERYRAARALDPAYAQASLGVAQVSEWLSLDANEWRDAAADAVRRKASLVETDAIAAEALQHLAEKQFPEACNVYDRLLARDSASFDALFGLGECRLGDSTVVADARVKTGYRFRGSFAEAQYFYGRALRTAPLTLRDNRAIAINRLLRVAPTRPFLRPGSLDGEVFAAEPRLVGDSITFYPVPLAQVVSAAPDSTTARQVEEAYLHNAQTLTEYSALWTREFPGSASAWYALATHQERRGDSAALASIRKARSLATSRADSVRYALDQLRIQMRHLLGTPARALADTLLKWSANSTDEAKRLSVIAALTGDAAALRKLLRMWKGAEALPQRDGRSLELPRPLGEAYADLLWYSVTGHSTDSLVRFEAALDREIDRWASPGRDELRRNLLFVPALLGFPYFGVRPTHRDTLARDDLKAQRRFAEGRADVRQAELDRIRTRVNTLGRPVSADLACLDASLLSEAGDRDGTQTALVRVAQEVQRLSSSLLGDFQAPAMMQRCRPLLETSTDADVRGFVGFLQAVSR